MKKIVLFLFIASIAFAQLPVRMTGRANGTNQPAQMDASSNSLNIIDYEHHERHDSSTYVVSGFVDVGNGDSLIFFFSVPDSVGLVDVSTKHPHMTFSWSSTKVTTFELFSGCDSIPKTATTITPRNARHGTKSSYVTVKSIANPAIGIFPKAAYGTKIDSAKVGATGANPASRFGGAAGHSEEEIYASDTIYAFLFISGDATNTINFDADWYEHTDKQ